MREFKSIGNICIKDNLNIIYVLCKIEYILTEDEKFKYIFTPNYSVIDLLDNKLKSECLIAVFVLLTLLSSFLGIFNLLFLHM